MPSNTRTATLIIIFALGMAVIGYLVTNPNENFSDVDKHGEHAATAPDLLIPFSLRQASAIEILVRGKAHRFRRDDENLWYLPQHTHAAAEADGTKTKNGNKALTKPPYRADPELATHIDKAFETLSRARIERVIARDTFDEDQFGLILPEIIIVIFTENRARPALTLQIGDLAPDLLSRYVRVVERHILVTIPNYHITNLLQLLAKAHPA